MHILMVFLDGIGLGKADPNINPFAAANLPTLAYLANGYRWLADTGFQANSRGIFMPLDPRMGVPGRPQSGSNQAAIVTGKNIPALIGEHYGPKPNKAIRNLLDQGNFFIDLVNAGRTAALLEAYPPRWHKGIDSGKRIPASYQYAVRSAGLQFMNADDFRAGRALSGDWTGEGWHAHLGFSDTPTRSPYEAGRALARISRSYDFAFFSHWMTDVVGHRGPLEDGILLLQTFDEAVRGLLDEWDENEGLIIITSDHGNLEDLSHGKHTENDVPLLLIGAEKERFAAGLDDLTGFVPRMKDLFGI